MRKDIFTVAAVIAATLLFAGCVPAQEPSPASPTVSRSVQGAAPTDTGDLGSGGAVDPSAVDPGITLSDAAVSGLPTGFPAGIPVYLMNVIPGTAKNVGSGYEVAFSGTPEDVVRLIDAFKVNGFAVSGSDVMVTAANGKYNIFIKSDPAALPEGAAYSYTVLPD